MKKLNKILGIFLVLVVGLFLASTVKGNPEQLIESIDGASIRTTGTQGLRFYAKVLEEDLEEKGF